MCIDTMTSDHRPRQSNTTTTTNDDFTSTSTRNSLIDLPTGVDPSTVDFVLVWRPHADIAVERQRQSQRNMFEERLCAEGLLLDESAVDGLFYVKVFATDEVLYRYAEVLRLHMPMKPPAGKSRTDTKPRDPSSWLPHPLQLPGLRQRLRVLFAPDPAQFPAEPAHFTAAYSRERSYLFDHSHPQFFTASVRSRIVSYILERKRYRTAEEDANAFGIGRLLAGGLYVAAYPLHDGDRNSTPADASMRKRLLDHWADMRMWWRWQPLDTVQQYLGVKIGMYFAWIGFYTWMLALAAVVGTLCFGYAVAATAWRSDGEPLVREVCDSELVMCPACDRHCDYWRLSDSCWSAKLSPLFDNDGTVFVAAFMSLWAALFVTLWRRYAAEIKHRWHLTEFDVLEEQPRPQYLAHLTGGGGGRWWWWRRGELRLRQNVVTQAMEPEALFWRELLPTRVLSVSVVLMLMALAVAAVFGVLLYRLAVVTAVRMHGPAEQHKLTMALATISAAVLNLVFIVVFDMVRILVE